MINKIIISGERRLSGEVEISGSKNASLPILAATLLTDEPCSISNVPLLNDIRTIISLLELLGKKIIQENKTIHILPTGKISTEAPYELVSKMRASVLVAGPLLTRYKKATVSLPGGCAIGLRPINIHLDGFKKLGSKISLSKGNVKLTTEGLKGNKIILDFPSVGATENLLMAAAILNGETIIENAAVEPEITDLANFLNKMGANISGIGGKILKIEGVKKLKGCNYSPIPDRIEAGTFIIASAITSGKIKITNSCSKHNETLIEKIRNAGMKVSIKNSVMTVSGSKKIKPVDIETDIYPGFPTDLQPMWMTLMLIASGKSVITEKIFENRFHTAGELIRMGADIKIKGNSAIIKGVNKLVGTKVVASDIRDAAALILAGLSAKGETEISGLEHLNRGYEDIVGKLKKLGADIKQVDT